MITFRVALILGFAQLFGILSGVCGLIFGGHNHLFTTGFTFIWSIVSNTIGLVALDKLSRGDQFGFYRLYMVELLFAWLQIIFFYPLQVALIWLQYRQNFIVVVIAWLCLFPVGALIVGKADWVVLILTQMVVAVAVLGHIYFAYLTDNNYGKVAAVIMAFNAVIMSVNPQQRVYDFSSSELTIIGLIVASQVFSLQAIGEHSMELGKDIKIKSPPELIFV